MSGETFSALTSWLLAMMLSVSGIILVIRCICEPRAPGIAFHELLRRLADRRDISEGVVYDDDNSAATRNLRKRLRRKEYALHTQLRLILWIGCVMLLSRLLILASSMVGSLLTDSLSKLFTAAISHWVRWDAASYIDLAHYGYTASQPELLAFLPLYPLLVRVFAFLSFGHYVFAGFLVSNLSLLGASWALYHIVNDEYGERTARRAVMILMFTPLSLVFSVPYAESLFLMLTLMSVFFARKHRFTTAAVFGALSACTRLIGLLIVIPLALESLKYLNTLNLRHTNTRRYRRLTFKLIALLLLVCAGTGVYLLINVIVAGRPFAFLDTLKEYFNQTLGNVLRTERYSVQLAFSYGDINWQLGTWIPQALAVFGAALLVLIMSPTIEPADGLYAWLYLVLVMSPSWMMSGPRSLTALYPFYIALAFSCRRKWTYIAVMSLSIGVMCLFSYFYALLGTVV